ncbi:MAG: DUF2274 domain-containing protein [Alphaproteobacteria bacterium]|nr:DUF2274 domain-containing protein [Alphaproteobacteria bacterium]
MNDMSLKIGPLPDRTPRKLTLLMDPLLIAELEDYARVHSRINGNDVSAQALVPHMLEAFMASDTGFRKARKALVSGSRNV